MVQDKLDVKTRTQKAKRSGMLASPHAHHFPLFENSLQEKRRHGATCTLSSAYKVSSVGVGELLRADEQDLSSLHPSSPSLSFFAAYT